ncbi:MAG TPA: DUF4139 domain-containing protein [Candidatus Polarisedimenticolaceae bacterium]|nr:DUF4139 domain-containing protein [Candidatus Polarisedimenticolaceae bacterium]
MLRACVFLLAAIPALAQERPPVVESAADDRKEVALTATQVGFGLVREVRRVDLPAGPVRLRLADVSSSVNPRSVLASVAGRDHAVDVRGVEFAYDLLSPERLLERYVGKEVVLVDRGEDLTERRTSATLLSVASGSPVFETADGILLGRSGPLLLPDLPEGLAARPSLLLDLESKGRGPRDLEVAYLADGLSWSADYVLMLGADSGPADLSAWVTVENRTGAAFRDATLKLVAGQVARNPAPMHMLQGRAMDKAMPMEAAAAPQFQQEGLGDLHLYTLDRPVNLPDAQSAQLALLSGSGIPVTRRYLLEGQTYWYRQAMGGPIEQDRPVQVELSFENSAKAGLGKPLPRGTFRVYQRDRTGAPQISGEAAIDHTPVDETVRVRIGEAFDVVADRVQTDYRALSPRQSESAYEIAIRNRKKEAVTVLVREPVGGQWEVLDSSLPSKKASATVIEFSVPVPPGQEVKLRYRVKVTS